MQKPLLGYVVAAVIGAMVSVVVGYLVYAAPGDAVTFSYWIKSPIRHAGLLWALVGLFAGAGMRFVLAR